MISRRYCRKRNLLAILLFTITSSNVAFVHERRCLVKLHNHGSSKCTIIPPTGNRNTYHIPLRWRTKMLLSQRNDDFYDQADNANDENDDEAVDENDSNQDASGRQAGGMRDRFKSWRRDDSPMVRPIRMEDGSIVEDEPELSKSSRIKMKFDDLFAGMPSKDQILGGDTSGGSANTADAVSVGGPSSSTRGSLDDFYYDNDDWFLEEKKEIQAKYDEIFEEMVSKLEEQKISDPENVPENALAMMKTVLDQELKAELKATKLEMEQYRLQQYESKVKWELDEDNEDSNQDLDSLVDEETQQELQKLVNEDLQQLEQFQNSQLEYDEFLKYEQEAIIKAENKMNQIQQPKQGENLDLWVLDRMQEMSSKAAEIEDPDKVIFQDRNEDNADEDLSLPSASINDILEPNIDDLQDKLLKQSEKELSPIQPQSLKEWQMYRSIATKLADERNEEAGDTMISEQLESWKDYIQKENDIRMESGLARKGPKLPFEWQELEKKQEQDLSQDEGQEKLSQVDLRKNVNRMSIDALESLIRTSTSAKRSEKLQAEIDALKQQLESQDYLDIDAAKLMDQEEVQPTGPVDLTGVFKRGEDDDDTTSTTATKAQPASPLDRDIGYRPPAQGSDTTTNEDIASMNFGTNVVDNTDTGSLSSQPPPPPPPPNTPFFSQDDANIATASPPPPPNTPFFDKSNEEKSKKPPPPPNTPFFDDPIESDDDATVESSSTSDSKLGTLEEQKLRAMYRRAGARTAADQEAIKAQWEEFQQIEKMKREESGLSQQQNEGDDGDGQSAQTTNLAYEMSDVIKDDGDIDADKILASIGPRPSRKKKKDADKISQDAASTTNTDIVGTSVPPPLPPTTTSQSTSLSGSYMESLSSPQALESTERTEEEEVGLEDEENNITSDDKPLIPKSKLDPEEVSDALYRSVSAVGGGRTKDNPETRDAEQRAFMEYMNRETELRDSLDQLGKEIESELSHLLADDTTTFNETEYAKDALDSLGERPIPRRRKRMVKDEAYYSDIGGARGNNIFEDEDESLEEDDESKDDVIFEADDDLIPGWLRKEREEARKRDDSSSGSGGTTSTSGRGSFLGSDIDDVFEDDDYEHNQRQLAEYERRRAGKKASMGIDISEVLGQRTSDDYADFNYDDKYFRNNNDQLSGGGWGYGSYEGRKNNLLEYTELEVQDVNSVMDYKDSVYSTGVSQYIRRINKPFKEFGAIFRLEGVLVDITGMHQKAWEIVANQFDFKMPDNIDDIRKASVVPAAKAIRDIFYWTDDVILIRDASLVQREAVKQVFNEWAEEHNQVDNQLGAVAAPPVETSSRGSLAIGEDLFEDSSATANTVPTFDMRTTSEEEKMTLLLEAWTKTAIQYGYQPPTLEQVMFASVLSADIAIKESFQWSSDIKQVDQISSSFSTNLQSLDNNGNNAVVEAPIEPPTKPKQKRVLDENSMMEIQYKVWTAIANDNGYEAPLPDEVLAAVVINDPVIAIRDGFGWTSDQATVEKLVNTYQTSLRTQIDEWNAMDSDGYSVADDATATTVMTSSSDWSSGDDSLSETMVEPEIGPSREEIVQMQAQAWDIAARRYGYIAPSIDEVRVTLNIDPKEVITRLFAWNANEEEVATILSTYENALQDISKELMEKYNIEASSFDVKQHAATGDSSKEGPTDPSGDEIFKVTFDAWTAVAQKYGFDLPFEEQVMFAMSVGPEEAILLGFQWVSSREDDEQLKSIISDYKRELDSGRSKLYTGRNVPSISTSVQEEEVETPLFEVIPGVGDWVKSLQEAEMQCGIVSYLEYDQVTMLLKLAGLSDVFSEDHIVSLSNNYRRDSDQLLGCSLRLERRPDHCVVFDTTALSSDAAHMVEMRSVGMIGVYPRYDLLQADSTAASFSELTAMNIRRLFSERVYDQPQQDMQQVDPTQRKKPKTKFYWEGDDY